MRGRKGGRERKETGRNLFYICDDEEESGKWGWRGRLPSRYLEKETQRLQEASAKIS